MTDNPTDAELLRFVAEFVGFRDIEQRKIGDVLSTMGYRSDGPYGYEAAPDYLNDLNAWHRDVVPKMDSCNLRDDWIIQLDNICDTWFASMNSTSRQRCEALWLALDGKLPERTE